MEPLVTEYPLRLVNLVQVAFAVTAIFGSALLWHKPRFRGLGILLVLEALLMVFNFSEESGLFQLGYFVTPIFTFLTGPAFYLFVTHLVFPERLWSHKEWLHFLPSLLALPFTDNLETVIGVGSLSMITYGVVCFSILKRYHLAVSQMRTQIEQVELKWLLVFMVVFAVLGGIDIIRINAQPHLSFVFRNTWYLVHALAVWFLFSILILYALKQPELFNELIFYESHVKSNAKEDMELDNKVFTVIDQAIKQGQLYLTPRLSLHDIASEVSLNPKTVSRAINRTAQLSFNDYINGLRVEYIKQQFAKNLLEDKSLLQIATDAGFNSKTTFNNAFKKFTGTTPSAYKKSINK
jgi:AraC-like DNA-binding protein